MKIIKSYLFQSCGLHGYRLICCLIAGGYSMSGIGAANVYPILQLQEVAEVKGICDVFPVPSSTAVTQPLPAS